MPKIKNRIISIIVLVLTIISVVSLSSCTKKLSKEEATAKVAELVVASYEINVIVYGEGLPTLDLEEEKDALYKTVMENDKYNSIKDIRDAISKIYSSSMTNVLNTTAFVGHVGEVEGTIAYARYIEKETGLAILQKQTVFDPEIEVGGEKVEMETDSIKVQKYDPSTIEIVKISRRFIEANITSEDGSSTILVTLVLENDQWKLDSQTY